MSVALTPQDATIDVPFDLHARGFEPRETVTIRFSSGPLRGSRVVHADARGEVVLHDQYLFAQMHPAQRVEPRTYASVRVTVRSGGAVASASARRRPVLFDGGTMQLGEESVQSVGFLATWVRPRHARHRTAVLLLGGSEGGLGYGDLDNALVAHGYPVLHLAYFGEGDLPPTLERIPLEYFERALRWMAAEPEVDPDRIVAFGVSRGGELALVLATTFPRLVHAAVGYTPSSEAGGSPMSRAPAWTYRCKPLLGPIPVERSSG
ncbi:MAG: alpha/beta hydrolase family protein, partial [Gaiella sp.]